MMKSVYIDQNIYSYLLADDKKHIDIKLDELSTILADFNLILSMTSCIELCGLKEGQDKLIREFKKCNLLYLPLERHLKRDQLKSYVYKHYFKQQYELSFKCKHISELFTFFNNGDWVPLGNN